VSPARVPGLDGECAQHETESGAGLCAYSTPSASPVHPAPVDEVEQRAAAPRPLGRAWAVPVTRKRARLRGRFHSRRGGNDPSTTLYREVLV